MNGLECLWGYLTALLYFSAGDEHGFIRFELDYLYRLCNALPAFTAEQVDSFVASLSPEDRRAFDLGTRLSRASRDALLATLSPQEIEDRGLRFPDEAPWGDDPPLRSEARKAEEELADARSAAFRPSPQVRTILMVLWYAADPLWLDLAVRSITDGVNIAFNGDSGPASASNPDQPPANMVKDDDPEQLKALLDAMMDDIKRGNATDFTAEKLFSFCRLIPCGVVPKRDLFVWRFIKDYSEKASASSVNASSPKIKSAWCTFQSMLARFIDAVGGRASSWDLENAYPILRIRDADRHLTVSFVKGAGFTHRLRGDMGLARSGFAYEIFVGKLLSTCYHVLSFCTSVDSAGVVTCDLPLVPPALQTQVSPEHPPSPRGFGDLSEELMLTDKARAFYATPEMQSLLLSPTAADVTRVSRWCDDFVNCLKDPALARRSDYAVIFWHRLLGFALSVKKFRPSDLAQEFYGVTFDVAQGLVSFDPSKLDKLQSALEDFIADPGRKSRRQWESLHGLMRFFTTVFPHMHHFCDSTASALSKARHTNFKFDRVSKGTPTTSPVDHCLADLRFWITFIKSVPHAVSTHAVTLDQARATATVVAHTDWAGSPNDGSLGFVILSHGLYAHGPMLPAFYEPRPTDAPQASAVGEATAVLSLLYSCPEVVRGRTIHIYTDNAAFVSRFNRSTKKRKDSPALFARIRDIVVLLCSLNARLVLTLIDSDMCLADPLTRNTRSQAGVSQLLTRLGAEQPLRVFSQTPLVLPKTPPSAQA